MPLAHNAAGVVSRAAALSLPLAAALAVLALSQPASASSPVFVDHPGSLDNVFADNFCLCNIDNDLFVDVVASYAEQGGKISWLAGPDFTTESVMVPAVLGVISWINSMVCADMDADGDNDVVYVA